NSYSKRDLSEDVFDLEARCKFDQGEAIRLKLEDRALRDVQDLLAISSRLFGAERQMLDLLDKFFVPSLEGEAKANESSALGYIYKAAGANEAATEAAPVDIAVSI